MSSSSPSSSARWLSIHPGVGLGPFRLGAPLGSILQAMQHQARAWSDVEISSDTAQPTQKDITVDIRSIGVRLRFASSSQRLTLIDIYEQKRVALVYMKTTLGGGTTAASASSSSSLLSPYECSFCPFPGS